MPSKQLSRQLLLERRNSLNCRTKPKTRATSAGKIVREVDVLFAELQKEIATKQEGQSAPMQRSDRSLRVLEPTQKQIDDLMVLWEERHVREKRREMWRDLAFTILGGLIGLGFTIFWDMIEPMVIGQ